MHKIESGVAEIQIFMIFHSKGSLPVGIQKVLMQRETLLCKRLYDEALNFRC